MRKIKINYEQALDVLAMHLESLGAIKSDEHIQISPLILDKNGLMIVYVHKNKGEL